MIEIDNHRFSDSLKCSDRLERHRNRELFKMKNVTKTLMPRINEEQFVQKQQEHEQQVKLLIGNINEQMHCIERQKTDLDDQLQKEKPAQQIQLQMQGFENQKELI